MFQYFYFFGCFTKAKPHEWDLRAHSFSKARLDARKLMQNQLLPFQSLSKSLVPPSNMLPYPCPIFINYFIEIIYE
jgi:hypothetical protein